MLMVEFHELNNSGRKLYMIVDRFDDVQSMGTGSAIKLNDSETPLLVHETPEEVKRIIEEKLNEQA